MGDRTIISLNYAIKNILRDKTNFNILSGFLTELLGRKVTVLEIIESESNKDDPTHKTNRLDLKAKISPAGGTEGEIAIFEIQFADQYDFFGKLLFNVSKAVVEQIKKRKKYYIKKVYMVSIAYFDLGAKQDYIFTAKMSGFQGVHTDENIPFAQNGYIEPKGAPKTDIHPEYYLILPEMFDERINDAIDEWVFTLKTSEVKAGFKAAGIQEAGEKLDRLKMTEKERAAYDRYLEALHDADAQMVTAVWKGIHKGREEGLQAGRKEGREEAVLNIVITMHNAGFSVKNIAKATKLTEKKVNAMLKTVENNGAVSKRV